ncbi:MAG: alkylhydroperoxidase [Sphingomonadales bacterium 63-6]|nr:MAG: alkylhydroperoxidase [Sphingomonadales bacterium 63-6]
MSSRPNPHAAAPKMLQDYLQFSTRVVEGSRLEHSLLELVKIRASQINGCANCLNMHTSDARKAGETEQRLHLIAAWWDAPCYTDRERAAFAWTDHITLVAERRAPDDVYAELNAHFDKEEQVQLTMAIIVMNGWNRLAVGFEMFDTKLGW